MNDKQPVGSLVVPQHAHLRLISCAFGKLIQFLRLNDDVAEDRVGVLRPWMRVGDDL